MLASWVVVLVLLLVLVAVRPKPLQEPSLLPLQSLELQVQLLQLPSLLPRSSPLELPSPGSTSIPRLPSPIRPICFCIPAVPNSDVAVSNSVGGFPPTVPATRIPPRVPGFVFPSSISLPPTAITVLTPLSPGGRQQVPKQIGGGPLCHGTRYPKRT